MTEFWPNLKSIHSDTFAFLYWSWNDLLYSKHILNIFRSLIFVIFVVFISERNWNWNEILFRSKVKMKRENRFQKRFALCCRCDAHACVSEELGTNQFCERFACFGFVPTRSNQKLKTIFNSVSIGSLICLFFIFPLFCLHFSLSDTVGRLYLFKILQPTTPTLRLHWAI